MLKMARSLVFGLKSLIKSKLLESKTLSSTRRKQIVPKERRYYFTDLSVYFSLQIHIKKTNTTKANISTLYKAKLLSFSMTQNDIPVVQFAIRGFSKANKTLFIFLLSLDKKMKPFVP